MIFAADPHPIATYVAGCICIAAIGALAGHIIISEWGGQWARIWSLFRANFRRSDIAARSALALAVGEG